jgi:hypothetical protein
MERTERCCYEVDRDGDGDGGGGRFNRRSVGGS